MNKKEHAILLRKQGKTYSEILNEISVAKSTLSLWLREVGLSKKQKQRITAKKRASALRGALSRKVDRINRVKIIHETAKIEVGKISERELWLIGIALYWAEGAKQKEHSPSVGINFINSDHRMLQVFILWLQKCVRVPESEIYFNIHIHENHKHRIDDVKCFWSENLKMPIEKFQIVRYKIHIPKTKRYNTGVLYNGCLQVKVRVSSTLNRKIDGWIEGIMQNIR